VLPHVRDPPALFNSLLWRARVFVFFNTSFNISAEPSGQLFSSAFCKEGTLPPSFPSGPALASSEPPKGPVSPFIQTTLAFFRFRSLFLMPERECLLSFLLGRLPLTVTGSPRGHFRPLPKLRVIRIIMASVFSLLMRAGSQRSSILQASCPFTARSLLRCAIRVSLPRETGG